ncbi:MAG: YbjN domain-containing protein [Spirosomataceae bacterium]
METPQPSTQLDRAIELVNQYVESIGLTQAQVFNPELKNWRWTYGGASIEVFFEVAGSRTYLRIFSLLMELPAFDQTRALRYLLELNDVKLGVKISLMANSPKVYATYERDIRGMDYPELSTCVADMEYWASTLKKELNEMFPPSGGGAIRPS